MFGEVLHQRMVPQKETKHIRVCQFFHSSEIEENTTLLHLYFICYFEQQDTRKGYYAWWSLLQIFLGISSFLFLRVFWCISDWKILIVHRTLNELFDLLHCCIYPILSAGKSSSSFISWHIQSIFAISRMLGLGHCHQLSYFLVCRSEFLPCPF